AAPPISPSWPSIGLPGGIAAWPPAWTWPQYAAMDSRIAVETKYFMGSGSFGACRWVDQWQCRLSELRARTHDGFHVYDGDQRCPRYGLTPAPAMSSCLSSSHTALRWAASPASYRAVAWSWPA